MWVAALTIVVALLAGISALLYRAGRARARALGEEVRTAIEPFLRRCAAQAGLPAAAPTWTARSQPEEIIGYSSRMAQRLLDRERDGSPDGTHLEYALTQPGTPPTAR